MARTVNSLQVNVPVLSLAISVQLPKPSTAASRRTITPRRAIRAVPMDRATVKATGSPSGMADTAKATEKRNISVNAVVVKRDTEHGHDVERDGTRLEHEVQARDHIDARRHHGRGMDERRHRRWAGHGVRQPDVQRQLRRLTGGADEQDEEYAHEGVSRRKEGAQWGTLC